ncbi:hypothetical protein C0216_08505 [Streptomyces globosus]|uniref:Uncharacterized protein n=1 Tax=Streptomyces globosus TaxID=68209 RepID=A0A344TXX7_9ACTN|nr:MULTISPECIES: hypothetical protein [Streptomyces]AXE23498.1 hypothetical protein C0216_08505 [Streptomyces globosus]
MSGDSYNFGNVVNMHGGQGNTGMSFGGGAAAGPALSPAAERALLELLPLVQELRTRVPQVAVQRIDESLPALSADAAVSPEQRYNALTAVAGIAATVGAIGQPVVEAVSALLGLLGG